MHPAACAVAVETTFIWPLSPLLLLAHAEVNHERRDDHRREADVGSGLLLHAGEDANRLHERFGQEGGSEQNDGTPYIIFAHNDEPP